MSPLLITRVPSVYSMHQLEDDYPQKGIIPTPYQPVSDIPGQLLPKITFPPVIAMGNKRVRSFGNLHAHLVPDIDEAGCAMHCIVPSIAVLYLQKVMLNMGLIILQSLLDWKRHREHGRCRSAISNANQSLCQRQQPAGLCLAGRMGRPS